jgi:intein/homing endonuclease
VTSRDPETCEVREVRVRALIPRGTRPIRAIELEDGRVLRVTDEHPLFDPRARAFREARAIAAGDHLLGAEGCEVKVLRVVLATSAPVYDLAVEGPHTFFAEGVLAHND